MEKCMKRYRLVAYNIGREIKLRKLTKIMKARRVAKTLDEPLYLRIDGVQVFIFSFGVVVAVNPSKNFIKKLREKLKDYVIPPSTEIYEDYEIFEVNNLADLPQEIREEVEDEVEEGEDIIVTDSACVLIKRKTSLSMLAIVSFVLAQSVALEKIENTVENILHQTTHLLDRIEKGSFTFLSLKPAVRTLTRVMRIRNDILTDLMLLEKPELTWEDPDLDYLYEQLRRVFEVDDRLKVVDKALVSVIEMSEFASELISASRFMLLEIAIVVLIVVEIVLTVIPLILK